MMEIAQLARKLSYATVLTLSLCGGVSAQTLNIGVRGGPLSMDPHFTAVGTHAEAAKHVFDTLVKSGNQLQLEPGLAESWRAVDATTWEFKLRPNVKFHDGSDFTAEDVKFSIERIPAVTGPNPTTTYVRRVKEIVIVNPLLLQIKTDGPAPNLPNDFVRLFVVSHTAAKDYSTAETAGQGFNSGKATIGTGPYKFVSWTPKEELVLDRFDGYWGGKEPWAKVIRKEIPNDAARVARLKAGQVDLISRVPSSDVPTLERDSKLAVVKSESVYLFYVAFDVRDKVAQVTARDGSALPKNPLADPRVREAFDLALDREALVDVAMEGMGKPVSQFVTPTIFGYNKSLKVTQPDVKRAKALLAEAGYPQGFKVVFSFTNDRLPGDAAVGTSITQMLAAIGVEVQAAATPSAVFFPARTRGDYALAMAGWGTLTGESNYTLAGMFHTNDPKLKQGSFNASGYSNPALDKLIQDAGQEMDEAKRVKQLEDAAVILAKDRPSIPVASIMSAWAMQKSKVTLANPRVDEDTLAMDIKPAK